MCNVSSSFSFFPIHRCFLSTSEMHFHFWSRLTIDSHHPSSICSSLVWIWFRLAFSRSRAPSRMASTAALQRLSRFAEKRLYVSARDPRMNAISPFLISRSIFSSAVVFFLSPRACCWRQCVQCWCTFAHIKRWAYFSILFSWEMRRHTKKECAQLAFFRCFDVRWHCSKVFFICFPCSLIDIIMHRLWL